MASQFGQRLAKKEMEIMRKFAEDTSEPIEINTND